MLPKAAKGQIYLAPVNRSNAIGANQGDAALADPQVIQQIPHARTAFVSSEDSEGLMEKHRKHSRMKRVGQYE